VTSGYILLRWVSRKRSEYLLSRPCRMERLPDYWQRRTDSASGARKDRSEAIGCEVALDVFCPVKVQAPALLAESVSKALWHDRFREQPLDHDILHRLGLDCRNGRSAVERRSRSGQRLPLLRAGGAYREKRTEEINCHEALQGACTFAIKNVCSTLHHGVAQNSSAIHR
jgi:hypothetical protein